MPRATDQKRIASAIREEMEAHGGVSDFCEKLISFPDQYCNDLAHIAMCEISKCYQERNTNQ